MRTLTPNQQIQTQSAVQTPVYLIEVYFPQASVFFCTYQTVQFNSRTYYASGVQVQGLQTGQGGAKQVTISINNDQFTWSALVLSAIVSGSPVKVYKLFGTAPYQASDAVLVFNGVIDDVPDMMDTVTLNCSTANSRTVTIPNVTIGPPYFNFMPAAGQTIIWGGQNYILQPR